MTCCWDVLGSKSSTRPRTGEMTLTSSCTRRFVSFRIELVNTGTKLVVPRAWTRMASRLRPKHHCLRVVDPLHYAQNEVVSNDAGGKDTEGTFNEHIKRIVKEAIPVVFKDKVSFPPLRKWVHGY